MRKFHMQTCVVQGVTMSQQWPCHSRMLIRLASQDKTTTVVYARHALSPVCVDSPQLPLVALIVLLDCRMHLLDLRADSQSPHVKGTRLPVFYIFADFS